MGKKEKEKDSEGVFEIPIDVGENEIAVWVVDHPKMGALLCVQCAKDRESVHLLDLNMIVRLLKASGFLSVDGLSKMPPYVRQTGVKKHG